MKISRCRREIRRCWLISESHKTQFCVGPSDRPVCCLVLHPLFLVTLVLFMELWGCMILFFFFFFLFSIYFSYFFSSFRRLLSFSSYLLNAMCFFLFQIFVNVYKCHLLRIFCFFIILRFFS